MGEETARSITILAIDVGNTVTRFGLFDGRELSATWEITTQTRMTSDEAQLAVMGFFFMQRQKTTFSQPDDSVLSCVVPTLTEVWTAALREVCGRSPLVVGPGLKTGIKMRYRDPAEIGSDRVADLVAVHAQYDAPLVVIDLGTTTNFEIIDAQGTFLGGIIAPGLALGARSLSQAAARLPLIELKAPASIIGTSTREAMQSGVVMGEVARIDGLIDLVFAELGSEATVIMTGASAAEMSALLVHEALVDDTLTLRGLQKLYEMNRRR